ncbi:MAG TPA: flavin reductase family protein [Spirochaetia bacterium]|nr:flavin reductase family protein [Spirochaetia bacterium]
MEKKELGAKTFLYPMPIVLVGAVVDGKPNFLTVAYCGIVQGRPPMISISAGKAHHTNAGIKENGTFSVNIPSAEMVKITDYCGLHSGAETDKSSLFEVFYGQLQTAPMIRECPLNMECKLVQTLDLGDNNDLFIGEIIQTYAEEKYLSNGSPDIRKMDPIVFSMHDNNYWRVGEYLGRAWSIGRDFTP